MAEKQHLHSYLSRLKKQVASDTPYGGKCEEYDANIDVTVCPSCGASRAKEDGLAYCAYCGYEFLTQKPTDGIYVHKEDA
jgi:hypothetical protein